MKDIIKALTALLKVKSLITLALLTVFSILAIRGGVTPEQVVNIFMIIVGFYFGTQATKDRDGQLIELHPEDFEGYEEAEPAETTHAIGFATGDTVYIEEAEEDG